jgi:hypothetical protein
MALLAVCFGNTAILSALAIRPTMDTLSSMALAITPAWLQTMWLLSMEECVEWIRWHDDNQRTKHDYHNGKLRGILA